MLLFEGNYFFVAPKAFAEHDMEFNVFNWCGDLIGTNFKGVNHPEFTDSDRKFQLETLIDSECQKYEAKLKFQQQYNGTIENINSLNLDVQTVIDVMEEKWGIPSEVMDEVLLEAV